MAEETSVDCVNLELTQGLNFFARLSIRLFQYRLSLAGDPHFKGN